MLATRGSMASHLIFTRVRGHTTEISVLGHVAVIGANGKRTVVQVVAGVPITVGIP